MRGAKSKAGFLDRMLATLLSAVLTVCWTPLASASSIARTTQPAPAEIRGTVLAADGLSAITGASVKAANMETRQVYSSAPTAEDGAYRLAGLPAGSYDIAVETTQGLFIADLLVETTAGKRTVVSLALRPTPDAVKQKGEDGKGQEVQEEPPKPDEPKPAEPKPEEPKPEEPKPGEGKQEPPPEPQEQTKKKKGGGFWTSAGGAAILIVAGAALVGAVANAAAGDDDNDVDKMTQSGTRNTPN